MRRIDELYTANATRGSRKMFDRLRIERNSVNRKHILRLIRFIKLLVICPNTNILRLLAEAKVYPNLIRDMVIVTSNQVLHADITNIRLSRGFRYPMAILDWYSKKVSPRSCPIPPTRSLSDFGFFLHRNSLSPFSLHAYAAFWLLS